jgi:hypothetical protein
MTVLNTLSTQRTNRAAGTKNEAISGFGGRLYTMVINAVQSGVGSANSTFELGTLPAGKWRYMSHLSRLRTTAYGTARTMDIGLGAYTEPDGDAISADEDAFHSAKDVAAAANWVPGQGDELDDASGEFGAPLINSRTEVVVTAKVEAGTSPDGARIDGVMVFLGV